MTVVPDSPMALEITITDPVVVEIDTPASPEFVVNVPGPQGPGNLHVGPTNELGAGSGVWVQTGLGDDGTGFTFWIEDGV